MKIEVQEQFRQANTSVVLGNHAIEFTPPLDGDYWLARVPLGPHQAVICFPKFFTIGIGFQHETDWNTNLPYDCDAAKIYDHIKHNRGPKCKASRAECIEAIRLIQQFAAAVTGPRQ